MVRADGYSPLSSVGHVVVASSTSNSKSEPFTVFGLSMFRTPKCAHHGAFVPAVPQLPVARFPLHAVRPAFALPAIRRTPRMLQEPDTSPSSRYRAIRPLGGVTLSGPQVLCLGEQVFGGARHGDCRAEILIRES